MSAERTFEIAGNYTDKHVKTKKLFCHLSGRSGYRYGQGTGSRKVTNHTPRKNRSKVWIRKQLDIEIRSSIRKVQNGTTGTFILDLAFFHFCSRKVT